MGVALPVFKVDRCCCGEFGGAGFGGGGSVFDSFVGVARSGGEIVSSVGAAGAGPLGWRKRPTSGEKYRVPPALYQLLTRAGKIPVFVQSRCGRDRDCISDDRVMGSYNEAVRFAYVWNSHQNGRYVDIFSEPGRDLLAHVSGGSGDYVDFLSDDSSTRELQLIQSSPNAGRFGFLPP
jgi:hypothetical protein